MSNRLPTNKKDENENFKFQNETRTGKLVLFLNQNLRIVFGKVTNLNTRF